MAIASAPPAPPAPPATPPARRPLFYYGYWIVGAALMGNLVVNVTLSKWWVEKRGQMIGIAAIGISIAGVLMPPVMTGIVDEFGWRTGWRVLAVGAWVLVYPAAMLMRRQPEDYGLHPDGKSDEEVRAGAGAAAAADLANSFTRGEALRTPALYLIVFAYGLSGVALGAVLLQTIPFLTDEGFDRATAAGLMALYSVPAGFSKPFWGLLIDRATPRYLASVSFMLTAVSVILMVVGATAGSLQILIAAFLLFGLAVGGTLPLQEVIWASYFGRAHLGAVRGVALPFSLVLGAGGPLAVSLYFDVVGNYHGAYYALSAFSVLAAFVILLARKPVKPGREPATGPPGTSPTGDGPGTVDGPSPERGAAMPLDGDGDGDGAGPGGRREGAPVGGAPAGAPAPGRRRVPPRDYMGGMGDR